jgi:hypothetical protein
MSDAVSYKYISHLESCFSKTAKLETKLIGDIFQMNGMTGKFTRIFYNHLLDMDDARYLEIGCYLGSSTCSAMYKNSANITCIDNWHDFILDEQVNQVNKVPLINQFLANIDKYKGDNTVKFINDDCFKVDISKLDKFNIYMYDGDHTHYSQYMALKYYIDIMDDVFIFVVDDWNEEPVRTGTFAAIRDLNLKNIWSKEIRLTYNNKHTPPEEAHATWWNGMYVCILSK